MPFSLFLRGSKWYMKVTESGKVRWKSTGCTDHAEAQKFLSAHTRSVSKKPARKPPEPILTTQSITLSTFIEQYLVWSSANHRSGSVEIVQRSLTNFKNVIGDLPLTAINKRHVDYFKCIRMVQIKPVTVNIELRTIRSALYQAKRWGLLQEVPVNGKDMFKLSSDTIALSEQEVTLLLSSIKEPWLKTIVLVAVNTGMRRNELCNLRWSDIDQEKGLLTIHESKSGKARCIPIPPSLIEAVKAIRNHSEWVFSIDGKLKVKGVWASHLFKKYCRKLGLSEKVHFHTLRHTCASIMVRNGVSLYHASKVLGHSSVVVTEKYYAHMGVEDLRGAVNVVGDRIVYC